MWLVTPSHIPHTDLQWLLTPDPQWILSRKKESTRSLRAAAFKEHLAFTVKGNLPFKEPALDTLQPPPHQLL